MQTTYIKGYKVTVFIGFDGKEIFIDNASGEQVYAARINKNASAMQRAHQVIEKQ